MLRRRAVAIASGALKNFSSEPSESGSDDSDEKFFNAASQGEWEKLTRSFFARFSEERLWIGSVAQVGGYVAMLGMGRISLLA